MAGLIEPAADVEGAESRRRARMLAAMLLAIVPLSLLVSIVIPAAVAPYRPWENPYTLMGAGASVAGLGLYRMARTRHHALAARATIGVAFLATWLSVVMAPGTPHEASAPYFLGLSVILCGLLVPGWCTAVLAAANVAGVILLPRYVPSLGYFNAANAAVLLVMLFAAISVFALVRRQDLARIEDQARALAEREETLRSVLAHAPVLILRVDRDGIIRFANRTMTGRLPEDIVGTRLEAYVPGDEALLLRERLRKVMHDGVEQSVEGRGPAAGGGTAWYSAQMAPLRQEGRVVGATLIILDITARKEAEAERARSVERASEIERLRQVAAFRSNFLNVAAHELRTPLTPIRTHVFLLKRNANLSPAHARSLEVVERNLARVSELVQEILDAARLDAGRLELNPRPLDLCALVEDAVDSFREVAAEAGLTLDATYGGAVPVAADPGRFSQVVGNLLRNAIRFTASGGRIEVAVEARGDEAVLTVRDTGAGLTAEDREHLFQPFGLVRHPPDLAAQGSGLSLVLCKEITERHGGHVRADSDGPQCGSTFTVTLPLLRPSGSVSTGAAAPSTTHMAPPS